MSKKVAEISHVFNQDGPAGFIAHLWDQFNNQRAEKLDEWVELRNYVFATDTSSTSNQSLPWKNSTTLPKLCQIRDNLHSNYISALFPNDNWLVWKGFSQKDSTRAKAQAIQSYIRNKVRESRSRTEISRLLYDYIDYGNAFAQVYFESTYKEMDDGTLIPSYIGPRVERISPMDIVFSPLATNFQDTFKIVRSVKTIGELMREADTNPDQAYWKDAIENRMEMQRELANVSHEDFNKAIGYQADGFGSMYEYLMSDYMEILTFYGDYRDQESGELHTNKIITVVDRSYTVQEEDIPNWLGHAPIYHVGWRYRSDNLWAMGPLDNLVGMQYRIDHLENLKADAMDLSIHPPLKIIGEVEEFTWGPNAEIHIDENGDVQEMAQHLNGILTASSEIQSLEDRMELYSGAPREAMGIRTPGEKTALEVQTLASAAGRIFQEKITNFEVELLEPTLNAMLETSKRNMNRSDTIRIMDDQTGFESFKDVTREDITASGVLRPVGARHFAKQAQDLQNLMGIMNSPIGQMVAPHTSGKELTKFIDDVIGLHGYRIFRANVAISEQAETQSMMQQAQEDVELQAQAPAEGL